jgi:hypothetical protein
LELRTLIWQRITAFTGWLGEFLGHGDLFQPRIADMAPACVMVEQMDKL